MKSSFCIIPKFIQLFFETDFNIYEFKKRNEWIIREYNIIEYLEKTDPKLFVIEIGRMFNKYDTAHKISIHPEIPPKKLLESVKPVFRLYLLKKYSICSIRREYYENELVYKMQEFKRTNTAFGRKIYNAVSPNMFSSLTPLTPPVQYNTNTTFSPNDPLELFMETHRYSEVLFNRYVQFGILTEPNLEEYDSQDEYDLPIQLPEVSNPATTIRTETPEEKESESDDDDENNNSTALYDMDSSIDGNSSEDESGSDYDT